MSSPLQPSHIPQLSYMPSSNEASYLIFVLLVLPLDLVIPSLSLHPLRKLRMYHRYHNLLIHQNQTSQPIYCIKSIVHCYIEMFAINAAESQRRIVTNNTVCKISSSHTTHEFVIQLDPSCQHSPT